jgi:hypothetical protein
MVTFLKPADDRESVAAAGAVHEAWNDALARRDVDAVVGLYADDATLESPLVSYLLRTERGIFMGKEALKAFAPRVFANQPSERRTHRSFAFTDGRVLMWEYPRATPEGDQMDFVEVMELKDNLIHRHRVYWGWFGLQKLIDGSHRR